MSTNSEYVKRRRRELRELMLEYLGGRCERCGWSGHSAGYDIHHPNPAKKEFTLSSGNTRRWSAIQIELDKCFLLCRNCHSIVHAITEEFWLDETNVPQRKTMEVRENSIRTANHCLDCGVVVSWRSERCRSCAARKKSKIEWPDVDSLKRMVEESSAEAVGRGLGVTGNAVRKKIKKNHVPEA